MTKTPLISIKNLSISTASSTVGGGLPLIQNYNLELIAGQTAAISAPTGSGKTSLFNYIAGILPEKSFTITGQVQKTEGLQISYAFQEARLLLGQSALKNVMLPLENIMDLDSARALAKSWLQKFKLLNKIDEKAGKLSGGEQQRTGLARAFAYSQVLVTIKKSPCLLLLDEPYASQDKDNIQNIKNLIKEQLLLPDLAILIISHQA